MYRHDCAFQAHITTILRKRKNKIEKTMQVGDGKNEHWLSAALAKYN